MISPKTAADLVLIVHASFIAFVVGGLLLIWVGIALHWRWVRNPWFRIAHLLCIGYVVAEAWLGITCFLTDWESTLRLQAGESAYEPGGFIAHWLHQVIFFTAPPWVFVICYTLFGLAVAGTLIIAPPRMRKREHQDQARHPC
jgi:hypothetical protein